MPEGIEVHADHVACADVGGEFGISHPGITEGNAEFVKFPSFSVNLDVTEPSEIHLPLPSGTGLIPVEFQDLLVISHWPAVLLDKGI